MLIVCDRDLLNSATSPAAYAITSKSTIQALDGFLLVADREDGTLTVTGFDLEKGIKVTISGEKLKIKESGSIIINAGRFSSILKNLPTGNITISTDDKNMVSISSNRSEFNMHGMAGDQYPLTPELKGELAYKIKRSKIKELITGVYFSVASNNSRPSLNGALFEVNGKSINVIGVDGSRMAVRRSADGIESNIDKTGAGWEAKEKNFIVPGKSLAEFIKLVGESDEVCDIEITRKHFIASFDNIVFFSRLIESDFIDYKRTIKSDPRTTVTVRTREFLESVERGSLLTEDKQKSFLKLTFKKNEETIAGNADSNTIGANANLQITSATSFGKVYDETDIGLEGDDIEIAFNHRLLSDALKNCGVDTVTLKMESPLKSMLILPYKKDEQWFDTDSAEFLYLILPLRIRD